MTLENGPPDGAEDIAVGYRKPPRATRFTKGWSGNPSGRPRGRHREAPYEAVLGQMVKIREGGAERHVTAAEAFLLQLSLTLLRSGELNPAKHFASNNRFNCRGNRCLDRDFGDLHGIHTSRGHPPACRAGAEGQKINRSREKPAKGKAELA
jgi:hypothetical protein